MQAFSFMNLERNLFFTETDFCKPEVIQGLLLNFSFCLETFFNNGAYFFMLKMTLLKKL